MCPPPFGGEAAPCVTAGLVGSGELLGLVRQMERDGTRAICIEERLNAENQSASDLPLFTLLTTIHHSPGPIKHQAFNPICILVLRFPFFLVCDDLLHFLFSCLDFLNYSPLLYRPDCPAPLFLDSDRICHLYKKAHNFMLLHSYSL